MSMILSALVAWIPSDCGGRPSPPVVGLRPTIRFQRDASAWGKTAWDVTILRCGPGVGTANVDLAFSEDAGPDMTYVKPGELIELLDAFRVIGVGKILTIQDG